MPGGQPSSYTPELAAKICELIAAGNNTRAVSKMPGMPHRDTIYQWMVTYPEFSDMYARAKQSHYLAWEEDIVEISDDGTNDWMERQRETKGVRTVENAEAINRSKLRVDSRKWLLSKCMPKKYGDRLDHNVGGELKVTIQSSDAEL